MQQAIQRRLRQQEQKDKDTENYVIKIKYAQENSNPVMSTHYPVIKLTPTMWVSDDAAAAFDAAKRKGRDERG